MRPLANLLKRFAPGAGTPTFVTEVLRLVSNVQLVKWLLLLNKRLEWPQLCISYPIHVWYGKIVPYAYGIEQRQTIRDTWFDGFNTSEDVALRFAVGIKTLESEN